MAEPSGLVHRGLSGAEVLRLQLWVHVHGAGELQPIAAGHVCYVAIVVVALLRLVNCLSALTCICLRQLLLLEVIVCTLPTAE